MKLLLVDWPKCRRQDRQTNTRSIFKLFISYPSTFSFFPIPWYHAIITSPPTSACISILNGFSTIANDVLHLGIDPDHFGIDLGVIARQDLRIPAGRDEDGVDTAGQWGGKDVGDLEAH